MFPFDLYLLSNPFSYLMLYKKETKPFNPEPGKSFHPPTMGKIEVVIINPAIIPPCLSELYIV